MENLLHSEFEEHENIIIDEKKERIEESYNEISFLAIENFSSFQLDLASNMDISHIQFKENEYTGINYNKPNRTFDFLPSVKTLSCDSYIQHIPLSAEWSGTNYDINQLVGDYGGYIYPAIMVSIIDPVSLNIWTTPYSDNSTNPPTLLNENNCFGQFNGDPSICGNTSLIGRSRPHGFFIFNYHSAQNLDSLVTFPNPTSSASAAVRVAD